MYAQHAVFRESVDAVSSVVADVLGWEPASMFRGATKPPSTPQTKRRNEILGLAMVQVAQIDLWRFYGVVPAGVFAVSMGEVVAPYAAGAVSREDTARAIAVVAQMAVAARESKRIFVLSAGSAVAAALCCTAPASLTYLGATSDFETMLIGDEGDAAILRPFLGGAVAREIATDWIYHTPALNFDRAWMRHQLRGSSSKAVAVPLYLASAGGRFPSTALFGVDHLMWMMTRPFHQDTAVNAALADGFRTVLNVAADPGTSEWIVRMERPDEVPLRFIDTMRPGDDVGAWRRAVSEVGPLRRTALAPVPAPATPETIVLGSPQSAMRAFEIFEELRSYGPVQYLSRHRHWLVLGFEEGERALAAPEVFSSRVDSLLDADPVLLGADPPDHTAVREWMSRYFTPADVARRSALAEQTAESLLQPLVDGKAFDVVGQFGDPLVRAVGCDLLGFTPEDGDVFAAAEREAHGDSMRSYQLLEQPMHERASHSSVYRELLASFSEEQARSLVRLLWLASTMETRRVFPLAVLAMLHDGKIRNRLRIEPARIPPLLDEVTRLYPPEHLIARITTEDVEIGGRLIPRGSAVWICIAAANRDPRRFEKPATIDLDTKRPSHLSFGSGVHRCLGAPLAKAQMIVALRALFRLAPDFHAVQPIGTIRWAARGPLREIVELVIER